MHTLWPILDRLHPLPAVSREALEALASPVLVAKGGLLQLVGHSCRTLYFLEAGIARIFYYRDGNDITEAFETDGALVVRAESLFTGAPSPKGIQALTDCRFVALPSAAVFALYDSHPGVERLFRRLFEEAWVHSIQRLESLQFHTAAERYEALLAAHPDILRAVPLKHIASYLGITQVSLSRIRAGKQ